MDNIAEPVYCQPTQPEPAPADNFRMTTEALTTEELTDVYSALWMGALMFANGSIRDPFPPELEQVAARFFELFPPATKA